MAAYKQYSQGKQTLNELSHKMGLSVRYIWKLFDDLSISPVFAQAPKVALNLVIDATFFGRYDGIMVFTRSLRAMESRRLRPVVRSRRRFLADRFAGTAKAPDFSLIP